MEDFGAGWEKPLDIYGGAVPLRPKEKTPAKAKIKAPVKKAAKAKKKAFVPRKRDRFGEVKPESQEVKAIGKQTQVAKDQLAFDKKTEASRKSSANFMAAAQFGLTVLNANSAYSSQSQAAQLNIMEARRLGSDAIERGKQRSLEAQVEGVLAGDEAKLALAAQGQDVSGAGVQKVVGSLEDIGLYNALQEETDSITEALGFDLEEVSIGFQLDQAEIQRDSTILSSALNFGATRYANTL